MTEVRTTEGLNIPYDISELVPHAGKMCLLDEVLACGDDWLTAQVKISADSQFVEGGVVSALVVIEYMAQSIAALAGARAKLNGDAVKIGLLLGTRKFDSNVDSIAVGVELKIHIEEIFAEENGLAVFKCRATAPDVIIACHLNVYQPEDSGELNFE